MSSELVTLKIWIAFFFLKKLFFTGQKRGYFTVKMFNEYDLIMLYGKT